MAACENAPMKKTDIQPVASMATEFSLLDSKSISLIQRKKQQMAIELAFTRRTTPERAKKLAAVCFDKTEGTVFMPFDLAEIALAETGGSRLSAHAVSPRGALGVWQLMPGRAKSHGYAPKEMSDDGKCAEAAVLELYKKLGVAHGNIERAKKLYCGQGPEADAYMKKIRNFRVEMLSGFERQRQKFAMADATETSR